MPLLWEPDATPAALDPEACDCCTPTSCVECPAPESICVEINVPCSGVPAGTKITLPNTTGYAYEGTVDLVDCQSNFYPFTGGTSHTTGTMTVVIGCHPLAGWGIVSLDFDPVGTGTGVYGDPPAPRFSICHGGPAASWATLITPYPYALETESKCCRWATALYSGQDGYPGGALGVVGIVRVTIGECSGGTVDPPQSYCTEWATFGSGTTAITACWTGNKLQPYGYPQNPKVFTLIPDADCGDCGGMMMMAKPAGAVITTAAAAPFPLGGPGTELRELIASLGLDGIAGCWACKQMAEWMDQLGVEGCREPANEARILERLRERAKAVGWAAKLKAGAKAVAAGLALNPLDPAPGLLAEAIRRAENRTP